MRGDQPAVSGQLPPYQLAQVSAQLEAAGITNENDVRSSTLTVEALAVDTRPPCARQEPLRRTSPRSSAPSLMLRTASANPCPAASERLGRTPEDRAEARARGS
jgi:hypothetical protein